MLLGARILNDVQNVNSYDKADVAQFTKGDPATVYFQLVDLSVDKAVDGYNPPGRRYVPAVGAVLSCVVECIDSNIQITRFATQPFVSDDRSIWALQFQASDKVQGTANIRITLTEGSTVRTGLIKHALRIQPNTCVDIPGLGYNIDPNAFN